MIRILFLLFFGTLHCSYAGHKVCWTSEQDMQLMNSIQKHGIVSWSKIAAEVEDKESKQCRERYLCHLDPLIDKSPLSDAEISTLDLAVQELGPKWSKISKERCTLPTGIRRTDLQLKNVWHSQHRSALSTTTRKRTALEHLDETPIASLQQVSSALPPVSSGSTNKKKKVLHSTVTNRVLHAQLPYSSAPSGGSHLLSNAQLPLNFQPLIMPHSNVPHATNSGSVMSNSTTLQPHSTTLQPHSYLISNQQPLTPAEEAIVQPLLLSGPELAEIFGKDNF
jgi:hypothetical protein